MSQQSLQKEVERGAAAKALLSTPVYIDAWERMRSILHEQWESLPTSDQARSHEIKLMLGLLVDLRTVFELAVTDGEAARNRLDELNGRKVLSPKQWMGR